MAGGSGSGTYTPPGIEAADELQRIMEQQQNVSTEHEMWVQQQVAKWAAMREGNRTQLKILADWPQDREYIVDPLAHKISEAFADMLFGEDPVFTSAATAAERAAAAQKHALAARQNLMQQALQAAAQPGAMAAGAQPGAAGAQPDGGQSAMPPAQTSFPINPGDVPPTPPNGTPPAGEVTAGSEANLGADEEASPPPGTNTQSGDQELLDNIIEANEFNSELKHAEEICSSEGEVWWRVYVDRGQMEYPIIEWYSRSHVRPLFRGRKLVAAGFVSELYREQQAGQWTVFRYIEIQAEGHTRNLLYRGTTTGLGIRIPLGERPETAQLEEEWNHDLGMLAGRIPNRLGRDRRYGISDYQPVQDLLFSLNEATTIGHENARLTAKKRVAVPREALGDNGSFDAGEDVIIVDEPLDEQMGVKGAAGNKFAVLEYTFDAAALIAHKDNIASIILTRVGIAQQFVSAAGNDGNAGMAASGVALRVRLIPTTLAAKGKGRFWDDTVPKVLLLAQLIDQMPAAQGGFERAWKRAADAPTMERGEPLPADEMEDTNRHALAVASEIESRRTAIADLHPEWDEEQVQHEIEQITSELSTFGPPKPPSGQKL